MLALEGIRVVEVTGWAAGPMAGRFLADLGADVIHVEHPVKGDAFRYYQTGILPDWVIKSDINYTWENYNCNKKSITIDLAQEGGREILYKLVKNADVFLNNVRPRDLKKFGAEYDTLSRLNPRLIHASITGYGKKGPSKDLPGFDVTGFWARAGITNMLKSPNQPPPTPRVAFGDNIAGMAAAFGIMTALFTRERTGIGQEVDVSLYSTGVFVLTYDTAGTLASGQDFQQHERRDLLNALQNYYQTSDGRWICLSIAQPDPYWSSFCRAMEREDLEHDPRFESFEAKMENHTALFDIVNEAFLSKTLAEWTERLDKAEVPWAPAQRQTEVIADPQARANDFFVSIDHPTYGPIELVASPIKLSKTPSTIRTPAPEFGQHTEEILLEHGYTWQDIEQFKQQGTIA